MGSRILIVGGSNRLGLRVASKLALLTQVAGTIQIADSEQRQGGRQHDAPGVMAYPTLLDVHPQAASELDTSNQPWYRRQRNGKLARY
jgi:hypothetical protein